MLRMKTRRQLHPSCPQPPPTQKGQVLTSPGLLVLFTCPSRYFREAWRQERSYQEAERISCLHRRGILKGCSLGWQRAEHTFKYIFLVVLPNEVRLWPLLTVGDGAEWTFTDSRTTCHSSLEIAVNKCWWHFLHGFLSQHKRISV